jgi:hypothetical protein
MSKHLYLYALPTDIERIIVQLREKLGVVMISPTSSRSEPTWLESPIRQHSLLPSEESTSVACCLVQNGLAEIKLKHYPSQSVWHVTDDSEVIQLSGCDFDAKVLVRGRFYCQTDMLVGNEIVPKRFEFLQWAESVFRVAKNGLQRSRALDAYLGPDASSWESEGGRFASLALPGQKIVFASRKRGLDDDPGPLPGDGQNFP